MKRFVPLLTLFQLLSLIAFADDRTRLDSLFKALKSTRSDTAEINTLNNIAYFYRRVSADSARLFAKKALQLADKKNYPSGKAFALNMIGISFHFETLFDSAISYYQASYELRKKIGEKKNMASSCTNLGIIYYLKGDYPEALKHYDESMKIMESLKDTMGMASNLNNIASIYKYRAEYEKSLETYLKALHYYRIAKDKAGEFYALNNIGTIYGTLNKPDQALETFSEGLVISKILKDDYLMAVCYTNMGIQYRTQGNFEKALFHFKQSEKICRDLKNSQGLAYAYNNIGEVQYQMGNYAEALRNFLKALDYHQKVGEKIGMINVMNQLGKTYTQLNDYGKAIKYLNEALIISKEVGSLDNTALSYQLLYKLEKKRGDAKAAYNYFGEYCRAQDSVSAESNNKNITEMQTRFQTERKEKEILLLQQDQDLLNLTIEKQSGDLRKQNTVLIYLGVIILLLIAFGYFISKTYLLRRRTNLSLREKNIAIREQKTAIENRNSEINTNLELGRKIQAQLLPHEDQLSTLFKEHFILYLPKEQVSGDFYWIKDTPARTLLAVVDCTGHGVPGAFMSMMAHQLMEETINSLPDASPSKILDSLNLRLIPFNHNADQFTVKLGMDISMIAIDKKTRKIHFAGAHNPLWKVTGDTSGSASIEEYKADKIFLGLHADKKFTEQAVETKPGDTIYLFSDGYADQIGESSRKKLLTKRFKELVCESTGLLYQQKERLLRLHNEWKGNREQIDDITVIGLRI